MLDLECEGAGALVVKLFQVLLDAVNPMNASLVEEDATKVLWTMLEESEDVGPEILSAIMERLVQPCKTDNSAAHALACAAPLPRKRLGRGAPTAAGTGGRESTAARRPRWARPEPRGRTPTETVAESTSGGGPDSVEEEWQRVPGGPESGEASVATGDDGSGGEPPAGGMRASRAGRGSGAAKRRPRVPTRGA